MKIRSGFVSNSSSSSFVVWGVKVPIETIKKIFPPCNVRENELLEDDIDSYLYKKLPKELDYCGDRYYFSDDKNENYIIGPKMNRLEDGIMTEIAEASKIEVVNALVNVGIPAKIEDVKLYVQMISNDNY